MNLWLKQEPPFQNEAELVNFKKNIIEGSSSLLTGKGL